MNYVFTTPDDPIFDQVRFLRHAVLREPIGMPFEADWDDRDPDVRHLVAVNGPQLFGYGRLVVGRDGTARIRFMCVDPTLRRGGVGSAIVRELVDRARGEGAGLVWLNARLMSIEFYRKFGFVEVGGLFNSEETHLPHKRMELRL